MSVICLACCGQLSFGCATYGLVEQVVTCIFSAVLIDYNRKYIDNIKSEVPSNCSVVHGNSNEYLNISTSLAKSQLAAAVLMLSMALAYSGIYIYTIIQVILRSRAGDTLKNQEPNYTLSPFQPPLFSIQPYPRNPIPPASRRIPKLLPDTSEVPIQNTEDTDF